MQKLADSFVHSQANVHSIYRRQGNWRNKWGGGGDNPWALGAWGWFTRYGLSLGFEVGGSGFRVQGSGFRVQGSGFRVQGSGFRVQGMCGREDLEGVEGRLGRSLSVRRGERRPETPQDVFCILVLSQKC